MAAVQPLEGDMATDGSSSGPLPDFLKASIRPDIVRFLHSNLSKNRRQPCAVSPARDTRRRPSHAARATPFLSYLVFPAAGPTALVRAHPATCAAAAVCSPLTKSGDDGTAASMEKKKGYMLPRPKMMSADLSRIINSDEVQSEVRAITKEIKRTPKKNPHKNLNSLLKPNPYAETVRRMVLLAEAQRVKAKKDNLENKRSQLPKEEAEAIKAAGTHGIRP